MMSSFLPLHWEWLSLTWLGQGTRGWGIGMKKTWACLCFLPVCGPPTWVRGFTAHWNHLESDNRSCAGVSIPPRGAGGIGQGCSVGIWIFQNPPSDCNVWPGLKPPALWGKQICRNLSGSPCLTGSDSISTYWVSAFKASSLLSVIATTHILTGLDRIGHILGSCFSPWNHTVLFHPVICPSWSWF